MRISNEKTQILRIRPHFDVIQSRKHTPNYTTFQEKLQQEEITLNSEKYSPPPGPWKEVTNYLYLGVQITDTLDVTAMISQQQYIFYQLRLFFSNKYIDVKTK
jgi:hypothetical protein